MDISSFRSEIKDLIEISEREQVALGLTRSPLVVTLGIASEKVPSKEEVHEAINVAILEIDSYLNMFTKQEKEELKYFSEKTKRGEALTEEEAHRFIDTHFRDDRFAQLEKAAAVDRIAIDKFKARRDAVIEQHGEESEHVARFDEENKHEHQRLTVKHKELEERVEDVAVGGIRNKTVQQECNNSDDLNKKALQILAMHEGIKINSQTLAMSQKGRGEEPKIIRYGNKKNNVRGIIADATVESISAIKAPSNTPNIEKNKGVRHKNF